MPVHRLDLVHLLEQAAVGIGGQEEALVAVLDVLRRHLAPVDGWLCMPARTAPQLEDVRGVVGLGPGLGQISLERLRTWLHRGARLDLHEPAMGEGHRLHGGKGQRLLRIEMDGIYVKADAEGAAPLRGLGRGRLRIQEREPGAGGDGGPSQLQQIATAYR